MAEALIETTHRIDLTGAECHTKDHTAMILGNNPRTFSQTPSTDSKRVSIRTPDHDSNILDLEDSLN